MNPRAAVRRCNGVTNMTKFTALIFSTFLLTTGALADASDGGGQGMQDGSTGGGSGGGTTSTVLQQWTSRLNHQYEEYQEEEEPLGIKGYHWRSYIQAAQNIAKINAGQTVKSIPVQTFSSPAPLPHPSLY